MNVVANVDDPRAFIEACRTKLNLGGFLLIQPLRARLFHNHEFDICYRENQHPLNEYVAQVGWPEVSGDGAGKSSWR